MQPESMRRKLVKQGPSTLTVSLPSTWVKANHLEAGNEVSLSIDRNNIIIEPATGESEDSCITLDIRTLSERLVDYLLTSVHKKGFEEVRLLTRKEQLARIEERISKNTLGFEIVKQSADSVVIRFVTRIDVEELPVLLRRTFLVTISLAEGTQNEHKEIRDLLVLEETNNRLTNYCERILVKNLYREKNAVFQYLLVWLLEKIADDYKEIIVKKETESPGAKQCLELLKQFYELFYKYSLEKHDDFVRELKTATEKLAELNSPYVDVLHTINQAQGSLIAMNLE